MEPLAFEPVLGSSRWSSPLISVVITSLKVEKGLALQDLIAGAYEFLETVELPNQSRIYLLDHLGSCE